VSAVQHFLPERAAARIGRLRGWWENSMEEKDLQQRFHLLQQEVEAAVSLIGDTKINSTAAIDALKIEVEVLRRFMERYHPDFAPRYAELRAEVIQEVNPEWIEPGSRG